MKGIEPRKGKIRSNFDRRLLSTSLLKTARLVWFGWLKFFCSVSHCIVRKLVAPGMLCGMSGDRKAPGRWFKCAALKKKGNCWTETNHNSVGHCVNLLCVTRGKAEGGWVLYFGCEMNEKSGVASSLGWYNVAKHRCEPIGDVETLDWGVDLGR